jgi:hypothetical protein
MSVSEHIYTALEILRKPYADPYEAYREVSRAWNDFQEFEKRVNERILLSDRAIQGWRLLVRQPEKDKPRYEAWLAQHPDFQYNTTVWISVFTLENVD